MIPFWSVLLGSPQHIREKKWETGREWGCKLSRITYIPSMPCLSINLSNGSQRKEAAQSHTLRPGHCELQADLGDKLYPHLGESRLWQTITELMGVRGSCLSHDTSPEYSVIFVLGSNLAHLLPSLPPSFSSSTCSPALVYCLSGNCLQVLM